MTSLRREYAPAIAESLRDLKRDAVARSIMLFAKTYLAHHFTQPPSSMHDEIAAELQTITIRKRGAKIAIAAPRGHAKSTLVTVAFILWCIVNRRELLIYVISNTIEQAAEHLSTIRHELEANELLRADFPEVCEPATGTPRPKKWRSREIVTRNGVKVVAFGAGSKLRGRKFGAARPSLIVLDDLEHEEQADSPERREKLLDWIHRSVLNCGTTETNVIVVGTILNYGSVLATLLDSPAWWSRRYQAITSWATREDLWAKWSNIFNSLAEHEGQSGPEAARTYFEANRSAMLEGAEVLWPERESFYDLMVMRLTMGETAFDCEKQNEPSNPRDAVFRASEFQYWDDRETEEELVQRLLHRSITVGSLDPSLGKEGRNRDDSAIITLLVDTDTRVKYVLDADIARRRPDDIIETVIAFQKRRKYDRFAVEDVQFQAFLASELSKRAIAAGVSIPVETITPTRDKFGRIQALQPRVHNGEIRFRRTHRQLLDQLKQFPKAAHDDGPDALEMAMHVAYREPPSLGMRIIEVDSRGGFLRMYRPGDRPKRHPFIST